MELAKVEHTLMFETNIEEKIQRLIVLLSAINMVILVMEAIIVLVEIIIRDIYVLNAIKI